MAQARDIQFWLRHFMKQEPLSEHWEKINYQFLKKKRAKSRATCSQPKWYSALNRKQQREEFFLMSQITKRHLDLRRGNVKAPTWLLGIETQAKNYQVRTINTEELWNLLCHKHAGPAPIQTRSEISESLEVQIQGGGCWPMLPWRLINLRNVGKWNRKGDSTQACFYFLTQKTGGALAQDGRNLALQADCQTFLVSLPQKHSGTSHVLIIPFVPRLAYQLSRIW